MLYLRVAARLFVVSVVESVVAVADAELGHILAVVGPALNGDSRNVLRDAQVDDQVLLEIGGSRRPCVATLRSLQWEIINVMVQKKIDEICISTAVSAGLLAEARPRRSRLCENAQPSPSPAIAVNGNLNMKGSLRYLLYVFGMSLNKTVQLGPQHSII